MSPKQLYFTILSFIVTIILIISGVYFIRQQQDKFGYVNILSSLYNEIGKEMLASSRTIGLDGFSGWLESSQNEELLAKIKNSKQEFIYCPEGSQDSFYVAWVKKASKLKTGAFECFSTLRGKISISLECKNALVCVRSK